MTEFLIIINISMIILTLIFIGKNIIINYKLSNSGLKNGCVAVFICVTVWCAGISGLIGVSINRGEDELNYSISQNEISSEEIKECERNFESDKKVVKINTLIAVLSLGGLELLRRNIDKEIKTRPTTSKWDLTKFK